MNKGKQYPYYRNIFDEQYRGRLKQKARLRKAKRIIMATRKPMNKRDGSGKGKGQSSGLRRNKNTGACKIGKVGKGTGKGTGGGVNRKT